MRPWLFQDAMRKAELGDDKCPWSVGWYNAEGKRKAKKIGGKSMAENSAARSRANQRPDFAAWGGSGRPGRFAEWKPST